MAKKRFWLALFLVLSLLLVSSSVFAGCCVGVVSCSRAFFASECSSLSTFYSEECEEKDDCDVVACCHDVVGIPKATYRATCRGIDSTLNPPLLSEFLTNPSSKNQDAEQQCSSANLSCQYRGCEEPNTAGCFCGMTQLTSDNLYCCFNDNAIFPNGAQCSASPSCAVTGAFKIIGIVKTPAGIPVPGAEVTAAGISALTDSAGAFSVEGIPGSASGSIVVTKGAAINSSVTFPVMTADYDAGTIYLTLIAEQQEIVCDDSKDGDGDQFGWNNAAADRCDPDCADYFDSIGDSNHVSKTASTVTATSYHLAEYSTGADFCSDKTDNDCDGLVDCLDPQCDVSYACKGTKCGDGVVQFPNSRGGYEQCDKNYTSGIGNDALCPGQCIAAGLPKECTCFYDAECGNGVVDAPAEECDGIYVASISKWMSLAPASNSTCGSPPNPENCGIPGSAKACQCPPEQLCGNGQLESPEDCDPGSYDGDVPAADSACSGECSPDCTCPHEAVCGDNVLQYGEDCDGIWMNDPTHAEYSESADFLGFGFWQSFKTRKYGCEMTTCGPPSDIFDNAYGGYTATKGTYATDDAANAAIRVEFPDGSCKCPLECEQDPEGPVLDKVGVVRWEKVFELGWSDSCTDNIKSYNVYRCSATDIEGSGCNDVVTADWPEDGVDFHYKLINPVPLSTNLFSYDDEDFVSSSPDADRYYCYVIEGVYDTKISPANRFSELNTSLHCVRAGDDICYNLREMYPFVPQVEEFCSENVRSTCDENNTVTMLEPKFADDTVDCEEFDLFCVGPYGPGDKAGITECLEQSPCEMCSDPFGLFSYSYFNAPKAVLGFPAGLGFSSDDYGYGNRFDYGKAPESPDDIEYDVSYDSCAYLQFCYMDTSYTSTDKFYDLSDKDCYDMRSLQACERFNETAEDKCEWVWSPDFGELGIGVCRIIEADKQECDRCHDPLNEVFGKCDRESCALYGRCYYDKANLGSEADEFEGLAKEDVRQADIVDGSPDVYYRCRPEREIACENYDSKEDCINSSSPYSISASSQLGTQADVDVSGIMTGTQFDKTSGSNVLTVPSDDFFGFGKCQYKQRERFDYEVDGEGNITLLPGEDASDAEYFRCFKNSDDNPSREEWDQTTPGEDGSYYEWEDILPTSDCGEIFSDDHDVESLMADPTLGVFPCRKDLTSPVTVLPSIYSSSGEPVRIAGTFELPAAVNDDSLDYAYHSEFGFPQTFACIAQKVGTSYLSCYPDASGKADFLQSNDYNLVTSENVNYNLSYNITETGGFISGYYNLRFFSQDVSSNLENITEYPIFIDADPPNVMFEFQNVSYTLEEDVWRTNLTMHMFISPVGENDESVAFCKGWMNIKGNHIYSDQDIGDYSNEDDPGEYGGSWSRNYTSMMDDIYVFHYVCEDSVGNKVEADIEISIEGDKSITDPYPSGTKASGAQRFGVETQLNSECRYQEAVDDLPTEGVEGVFAGMTKFFVTGTDVMPQTMHYTDGSFAPGFHRLQVRCRIAGDGIVGNNGDSILFAVDTEGPVTAESVEGSFYNGWFNGDVQIKLTCMDIPILGYGLDWAFGCENSVYCTGLNCWDDGSSWKNYSALGFTISETSYVSYRSLDKGGNYGPWVKDKVFSIDTTPPVINISLVLMDSPAYVVVINTPYKVVVKSSEPFIAPTIAYPTLSYTSMPSKFSGSIELFPASEDNTVWEGVFYINNTNPNKGYEGALTFTAKGRDNHNVSGIGTYTIRADTKAPDDPVLVPSLDKPSASKSEYQALGYPINFVDGVYYTNETSLFLTGKTTEPTVVTAIIDVDGLMTGYPFIQTNTNITFQDVALYGMDKTPEIRITGDITKSTDIDHFIGFDKEVKDIGPRDDYLDYGKFYDVTGLQYVGGDEDYTVISLSPDLQEFVKLDRDILFYTQEHPSLWFGIAIPVAPLKMSKFYIKATDDVGNVGRYPKTSVSPSVLTFFGDPVAPKVMYRDPYYSSTSKDILNITLWVREGKQESGIWNASINFTLDGVVVPFNLTTVAAYSPSEDAAYNYYAITHQSKKLAKGNHTVRISATDKAKNSLDESLITSSWTFYVDKDMPAYPEFSLVGGFKSKYGPERWYAKSSPDFTLDFSAEAAPVNITDIFMEDSPTEGDAASCTMTSPNVFLCEFAEPKTSVASSWADYGVIVTAYKTLKDGTKSPTGVYGPFQFTVDDTPPIFSFLLRDSPSQSSPVRMRFMDNVNLSIFAVVTNEHHPLEADIEILGQHYTPYYSANNGEFYDFWWEVPDYGKESEGETDLTLTLSDFAGNSHSVTKKVYIDLTAPRIENLTIDYSSNTVKIGGEVFTGGSMVSVSGIFLDDDIEAVWIEPGNFNMSTGKTDGKSNGVLKFEGDVPVSFIINISLPNPTTTKESVQFYRGVGDGMGNEMVINSINNMTLYALDKAGHKSVRKLKLIRDYAPPLEPMFCIGRECTI